PCSRRQTSRGPLDASGLAGRRPRQGRDCRRVAAHARAPDDQCLGAALARGRSEEHTSELQSLTNLVCRLLLEKKKKKTRARHTRQLRRTQRITSRRGCHTRGMDERDVERVADLRRISWIAVAASETR